MGATAKQKILLTGGNGNLGTEIRKLVACIAPDIRELDVTDFESCQRAVKKYRPDIIIHCAAWTDVAGAEQNIKQCWEVNVTGTRNMLEAASGRRFVFISTDYVFDGQKGNYNEEDIPNPTNIYSLTKLLGEVMMKQYPKTLTIRTAFKKDGPWPYARAFVDQWVSHEFVSVLAPDIVRAACMKKLTGLVHIAGTRKTIYDLARAATPSVGKMSVNDANVKLPHDTSLNSSKWQTLSSLSNRARR